MTGGMKGLGGVFKQRTSAHCKTRAGGAAIRRMVNFWTEAYLIHSSCMVFF